MDIYVVQWASIGPPREIFLGGAKPISGLQDLQNYFEINKNWG